MLIFEKSHSGRCANSHIPNYEVNIDDIPKELIRSDKPLLPEVSELEVVRHITKLSQKNFSIDTHFYPLGSCTMKYNPHCMNYIVSLPRFLNGHPLANEKHIQGFMRCGYELQEILKIITGMKGVSLTPMAGAQGELAGVLMIRAYHESKGDVNRTEIIIPDAAHGTNPASAVMGGYKVKEIPTDSKTGDLDIEALKMVVGPQTAGIMLTNPSTVGVFERSVLEIADIVHKAGGLLYYDGANLNAILGKVKPADMGFDVMHINLHKTFGTPHGGGGPGAGPVAVNERLLPFLPGPIMVKTEESYKWSGQDDFPLSIGKLSAFIGNASIILRAYIYVRLLGLKGMQRVAEFATLNANYLMVKLREGGFNVPFKTRRAVHEFVITLQSQAHEYHATALDFAKRLLDYGIHSPTIYFPLLIPECMLIEPTETETKETLDHFVEVMRKINEEAKTDLHQLKEAPHVTPVGRLDDVKAARELNVIFREKE